MLRGLLNSFKVPSLTAQPEPCGYREGFLSILFGKQLNTWVQILALGQA